MSIYQAGSSRASLGHLNALAEIFEGLLFGLFTLVMEVKSLPVLELKKYGLSVWFSFRRPLLLDEFYYKSYIKGRSLKNKFHQFFPTVCIRIYGLIFKPVSKFIAQHS